MQSITAHGSSVIKIRYLRFSMLHKSLGAKMSDQHFKIILAARVT